MPSFSEGPAHRRGAGSGQLRQDTSYKFGPSCPTYPLSLATYIELVFPAKIIFPGPKEFSQ
jgi:hypothetical protein